MPDVFEIAEILVSHAVRAHPDEVAIIAYYGSHAKGTASPTSDLDIFYIPDAGKAGSLCSQFIIDGLPYDFWPVSWQLAEDIANARSGRPWAVSASLIADAQVLYHRSTQDLMRFEALQARIAALTRPEGRPLMVAKALDAFKDTLFQLGQMRLAAAGDDGAGLHWAGQKFVDSAVNCLALVNQTYFSKGWGANLSEIFRLPRRLDGLREMMHAILLPQGPDDALAQAAQLARGVREILRQAQAALAEPQDARQVFQDFYFFVLEYKHKVLSACAREDKIAARYAATLLQQELCQMMNKVTQGFYGTDFNLLGEYVGGYQEAGFPDLLTPASQGNLETLARRTRALDEKVQAWFERHTIRRNVLTDEEVLRRFLARDPL